MKHLFWVIPLCIVIIAFWKNNTVPNRTGLKNNKLYPCGWTKNCINSRSKNNEDAIDPIKFESEDILNKIELFFKQNYNSNLINKTPSYLHIVVSTSFWHFKDDVEFLVDQDQKIVEIRSASRLGYSDMGVNRKRIEKLKKYLKNF